MLLQKPFKAKPSQASEQYLLVFSPDEAFKDVLEDYLLSSALPNTQAKNSIEAISNSRLILLNSLLILLDTSFSW